MIRKHDNDIPITTILTQYPQPFINNFDILRKHFGKFENIIRDLLVFLAHKQQTDLFGCIEFDMDEFCSKMAYDCSTMRRNYRTLEKREMAISIIHDDYEWDGYFEFALLYMLSVNCLVATKVDGVATCDSFQLLSKLEIDTRSKRKIFRVKLGHSITYSFFKRYINIELNDYVQIQKLQTRIMGSSALNNLYLYLMQCYSEFLRCNEKYVINLTVDDVSKIINYPITDENHRKRKHTIKTYLEKIKTLKNIFFNYSFEKFNNTSRFSYVVTITFSENKELASDPQYHKFKVTILNKYENLYKKLKNLTAVTDSNIANDFINWFYDPSINEEEKQLTQVESINITFEIIRNATSITPEQRLNLVRRFYHEKNLFPLYQHLKNYEDNAVKAKERISDTDFGLLIVKNEKNEIKRLIEDEHYTYHVSNPLHIQTAYLNGSYTLVKYFAEKGSTVTKHLFDLIQSTKTKQSKKLYDELLKMKNDQ